MAETNGIVNNLIERVQNKTPLPQRIECSKAIAGECREHREYSEQTGETRTDVIQLTEDKLYTCPIWNKIQAKFGNCCPKIEIQFNNLIKKYRD